MRVNNSERTAFFTGWAPSAVFEENKHEQEGRAARQADGYGWMHRYCTCSLRAAQEGACKVPLAAMQVACTCRVPRKNR